MTWKDELRPASFRGVPFLVDSSSGETGHRLVVHDYPGRDKPLIESLGRSAREFSFNAYVIGSEYLSEKKALLKALEEDGVGELIHHFDGNFQVRVRGISYEETKDEGGKAVFSLSFIEDAGFEVSAQTDTRGAVISQSLVTETAAVEAFDAGFVTQGVPEFVRQSGVSDFVSAGLDVSSVTKALSGSVQSLVPDIGPDLVSFSAPIIAGPVATATRAVQAQNSNLVGLFVRSSAVINTARQIANTDFTTFDEADATLNSVVASMSSISDAVAEAGQLDLYREIGQLRSLVTKDVVSRGADLARVIERRTPQVSGALVEAYRYFEDAGRADEIVSWNPPISGHPAFLPTEGRRLNK